ncbi:MAG: RiPP maturation radical SAM C-methyltransferase [Thermoguttaceae bacterium]|jgi:ribosomal peptide maturation radical SAM protein 1
MPRVLIVNMPFSNLRWPNLGPSLLKAGLVRRGIGCDLAYFNFDFAERVGLEHYYWIADYFAFVLGGERLFAKRYFEDQLPSDERYFRDVLLDADDGLTNDDRRDYEATIQHVDPFLDQCMAAVDWAQYAIVGFAATFQQTMPSLCLAQRIKKRRPQPTIVFGGAACEGEMGIELLRQFAEIDYVFLGEADRTFPALVEQILAGQTVELPPGVVGRQSLLTEASADCAVPALHNRDLSLVEDLDELPYPDFDDYFARLVASPLKDQIDPLLFYETSRGCWWGQKHHCKFCGLNGSSLAFRSKSPKRAVEELRHLVKRYGVYKAAASDNIFDYRYFDTFLPLLKEAKLGLEFVYEMKTNLTRQQVETLLEAGLGAAQLGIETFITPVLRLAGKGASALQNLQTLKWFSEPGIEVKWNLLYGFPGENPADYTTLAKLLPLLYHLHPPMAVGRVRMDRFSPYFEAPDVYGMVNPRPNEAFRYTYPFSKESLARLAYYYEFDYADRRDPLNYVEPVLEAVEKWQRLHGTVTLRSWDRPDGVLIVHDTRPSATAFQHRMTDLDRAIYLYCDTGRSLKKVVEFASQNANGQPVDPRKIERLLDQWVAAGLMVYLDDRYLSLALWTPKEER